MKKLLSLTLAIVIALSILIIPMGASAKAKPKKSVNTYIAKSDEYITDKGRAYFSKGKLFFTNKKGKTYLLSNKPVNSSSSFYVRGDTVYFYTLGVIFSVSTTGKNFKRMYGKDDAYKLLGGYGSAIIISIIDNYDHERVCKIKDGKTTILFERNIPEPGHYTYPYEYYCHWDVTLFNGKLYDNSENKVYDLATNKVKSFKASQIIGTKNYLYYVNKLNNLRRIDKKGNNKLVAKNVTKLHTANDGATVVFGKKNTTTGKEYLYRKTGISDQIYRLCSVETLGATLDSEAYLTTINSAYIVPGKVYLLIDMRIVLCVNSKGGTPEVMCKAEGEYELCSLEYSFGKIKYGTQIYDIDDFYDDF